MKLKSIICLFPFLFFACNSNTKSEDNKRYIVLKEFPPLLKSRSGGNGPHGTVIFSADSNGFLMPSIKYTENALNVFFFGGSTTACILVPSEYRFPFYSGKLLEQKFDLRANCINVGYPGSDILFSYLNLLNKVVKRDADVVVLMNNINDLTGMLYCGDYWKLASNERQRIKSFKEMQLYVERFAERSPWLLPHLRNKVSNIFTAKEEEDEWKTIRDEATVFNSSAIQTDFKRALKSFILTSKIYGIEPVLMTQVNRIIGQEANASEFHKEIEMQLKRKSISYTAFNQLYKSFNEIILEVGEEEKIMVIDLNKYIQGDDSNTYDLIHLNKKGSKQVAEIISDSLHSLINRKTTLTRIGS